MKDIARRNGAAQIEAQIDDVVPAQVIEDRAVNREARDAELHQVKFGDLAAVVADGQRERLALFVKAAGQVQHQVRDGLIIVRALQDAAQGRVDDALTPAVLQLAPMVARTHGHGLGIGRDTRLDHCAAFAVGAGRVTHLPPVHEPASDGRE